MPQVKDQNIVDGWYKNASGRPWAAATISFDVGRVKFVPARVRQESRSVNTAFERALASGDMLGPAPTANGPWGGESAPEIEEPVVEETETEIEEPAPEPEAQAEDPEPPAVEEPAAEGPALEPEPEPPAAEEPVVEEPAPETETAGDDAPKKKRSRRRRSS